MKINANFWRYLHVGPTVYVDNISEFTEIWKLRLYNEHSG